MAANNPAGRLHALLSVVANMPRNSKREDVWRKVFGVEAFDRLDLLERLGSVYALPNEVRRAVLAVEGEDHDVLLDWIPIITPSLQTLHLTGGWEVLHDTLTKNKDALRALVHCNSVLSRASPEPVIPPDQLDAIRTQVRQLRDEVVGAEQLDGELKIFLLEHLREIENAVENYRIQGTPGIRKAVNDAIGQIRTNVHVVVEMRRSSIGMKVLRFLQGAALVGQLASGFELEGWLPRKLLEAPTVAEQPEDVSKIIEGDVVPTDAVGEQED